LPDLASRFFRVLNESGYTLRFKADKISRFEYIRPDLKCYLTLPVYQRCEGRTPPHFAMDWI
jgi:hypothetical protein